MFTIIQEQQFKKTVAGGVQQTDLLTGLHIINTQELCLKMSKHQSCQGAKTELWETAVNRQQN